MDNSSRIAEGDNRIERSMRLQGQVGDNWMNGTNGSALKANLPRHFIKLVRSDEQARLARNG